MFKMPKELKLHEDGHIKDITDEMKGKIKEVEGYGDKVVFVIKGEHLFPFEEDPVSMTCYVLKGTPPWKIGEENKVYGLMAYVVNDTWGIEETGSIGVIQYPDGYVRRIM